MLRLMFVFGVIVPASVTVLVFLVFLVVWWKSKHTMNTTGTERGARGNERIFYVSTTHVTRPRDVFSGALRRDVDVRETRDNQRNVKREVAMVTTPNSLHCMSATFNFMRTDQKRGVFSGGVISLSTFSVRTVHVTTKSEAPTPADAELQKLQHARDAVNRTTRESVIRTTRDDQVVGTRLSPCS